MPFAEPVVRAALRSLRARVYELVHVLAPRLRIVRIGAGRAKLASRGLP